MKDYSELRRLAESAKDARAAMWAHQRATHGPWPAWCNDCLEPSDAAERADRAYGAAANPFAILGLLEEIASATAKKQSAALEEKR